MGKFIVKYRYVILAVFMALIVISVILLPTMINKVNYDLTSYLPDGYETNDGYKFLSQNFNIHGDVEIGVQASREDIKKAADEIYGLEGVTNTIWASYVEMLLDYGVYEATEQALDADGNPIADRYEFSDDFKQLYSIMTTADAPLADAEGNLYYPEENADDLPNWALLVTLSYPPSSQEAIKVFGQIEDILAQTVGESNYAMSGMTEQANALYETVFDEIWLYLLVAGIVVLVILAFTTNSLMEPLILILTLAASIVINLGTNAIFPSTSMITFAVSAILQLGLSMDYAIFLLHQYRKELSANLDPKAALAAAIPKSAKSVAASALTTICGFLALMCMQFQIGTDLGLSLAKGILCSLLTVLLLQPCFMLMLDKARVKTQHKCLDVHFRAPVKRSIKSRGWVTLVFALLFVPVLWGSTTLQYSYVKFMPESGDTSTKYVMAKELGNQVMIVVPNQKVDADGNPVKDADGNSIYYIEENYEFVNRLKELAGETVQVNGNTENKLKFMLGMYVMIPEGSVLQFEGMSFTLEQVFRLIDEVLPLALDDDGNIDYGAALVNFDKIMAALKDIGISVDTGDLAGMIGAFEGMQDKLAMFTSYVNGGYTMYTVGINPAIDYESQQSFDILDEIKAVAYDVFGDTEMRCYFTGYTQGAYDFAAVTPGDYTLVTIISIVAILVILIVTLGSVKFPVLLVALIEFGIWINLLMQYIFTGGTINFMSYLVITAVQLGATVDYAILITTKFRSLRKRLAPRQAAYEATTSSVMSVLTSALIMAGACFSICFTTTNLVIEEMTFLIARGALISAILVIFVLPALLSFADKPHGGELYIPRTPKLRPYVFKRRRKYKPDIAPLGSPDSLAK